MVIPFSAETRMSGIDFGGTSVRKGAADAIRGWIRTAGKGGASATLPAAVEAAVQVIASKGGTLLRRLQASRLRRGCTMFGLLRKRTKKDLTKSSCSTSAAKLLNARLQIFSR